MTQATISPPLAQIDVLDLLNQAVILANELEAHEGEHSHLGDAHTSLQTAINSLHRHLEQNPQPVKPIEVDGRIDYDFPW
jgi:hypothetical protein